MVSVAKQMINFLCKTFIFGIYNIPKWLYFMNI